MTEIEPRPAQQNHETRRHPDMDQVATSRELVRRIQEIYENLLTTAITRGVTPTEVKLLLVSGWNSGKLSRVVEGEHYRGSGYTLNILHGEVPIDIFDRFVEDEDYGLIMPNEDYPQGSVTLAWSEGIATQPDPNDPSAFYVETFRLPQIVGHHQFFADQVATQINKVKELLEMTGE